MEMERIVDSTNLLESAYRQYRNAVMCFVRSYVRDRQATEDIVSDSFLELWRIAQRGDVDSPYSLLVTIARHRSLDWLRHRRVKQSALSTMSNLAERDLHYRIMALEACNPEELFSGDIREVAERTLRSLSPVTYRIFTLSRYDHMPVKEIAALVGLSPKSVEYHITKALKALRSALEGYLSLLVMVMIR